MKTAISVPDEVFERAEHTAKRLKLSRSELYSRALAEYLSRHTPEIVTAALDAAISESGQPRDDASVQVGRRRLGTAEW
ncbi:MAG: CopG family transcriptional regulator [Polyangiaceae bacterium]|nr:CopG family transcriptional regulator [Polyangiaceae bacterium]